MPNKKSSLAAKSKTVDKKAPSRSSTIASRGIYDAERFAQVMSALMTDVLTGAVEPNVANAACNAGGKLLKIVDMKLKSKSNGRSMILVEGTVVRR